MAKLMMNHGSDDNVIDNGRNRKNLCSCSFYGESNVQCKTDREKEDRGPNGDVGIEGNSGSSDGKDEWIEMVRACVEEG